MEEDKLICLVSSHECLFKFTKTTPFLPKFLDPYSSSDFLMPYFINMFFHFFLFRQKHNYNHHRWRTFATNWHVHCRVVTQNGLHAQAREVARKFEHTRSVKKMPETARGLFLSVCADPYGYLRRLTYLWTSGLNPYAIGLLTHYGMVIVHSAQFFLLFFFM